MTSARNTMRIRFAGLLFTRRHVDLLRVNSALCS